jgi:hypothetical protein
VPCPLSFDGNKTEMIASRFPAKAERAAATGPVQVSALRLMDIRDDEAASLIRPVIGHPHQPIIPRLTKH